MTKTSAGRAAGMGTTSYAYIVKAFLVSEREDKAQLSVKVEVG
jgi:hypothetical protein